MLLALCLPQTQLVSCYYTSSLCAMSMRIGMEPMGFKEIALIAKGSSMLPHLRQMIAEEALEKGATHLLWIDSDHSFPELTAHRLIAHRRPFVGINASTRTHPVRPTARLAIDRMLYTTDESTGLERVWSIGFGLVLIESRVFQAIEKPWFNTLGRPDGSWIGEDAYFCEKAREAGFWPMVDHDLTKETHHYGSAGFHSRDARNPDAAR